MDDDDPRLVSIHKNADLVVTQLGPLSSLSFGYDKPSVEWLDGYIERVRTEMPKPKTLIDVLGSYLGEAILRRVEGARWDEQDGRLGITFANGFWCNPFGKVEKQFEGGAAAGESIASFYNISIEYVATGKLRDFDK